MPDNKLPSGNRSKDRSVSLSERPLRTPLELETRNRIEEHIKKHLPGEGTVSHELITSRIHIDIHIRMPTPYRNFITLVTSGMSSKPMNAPYDFQKFKFAELLICLPPDWDLSENAFNEQQKYWPINCLRNLALRPHANDTWLWTDHLVPNGEPPKPFANNTKLCGALIRKPVMFREDFVFLKLDEDRIVHFLTIIPIYKEEMVVFQRKGPEALRDMLDGAKVNELMHADRKNTAKFLGLF